MKIRQVGTELFHADGQTDRHDEVNSGLFKLFESVYRFIPCQERKPGCAVRSAESNKEVRERNS
jgi:hypothetical protein